MANDLVLPAITAEGLVHRHDVKLVQQLRSSWNVRLRTKWKTWEGRSCLETIDILEGATVEGIEAAIEAVTASNAVVAGGAQLAKAIAVLTAVCARPADFDDAKVVLWSERLKQVLQEFPADVALATVTDWPKTENGKWWPTEKEIRDECEHYKRFRSLLLFWLTEARMTADPTPKLAADDGKRETPYGATLAFMRAWRERSPRRVLIYANDLRFTETELLWGGRNTESVIHYECGDLLREHGVSLVEDRERPWVTKPFYEEEAAS